MKGVANWYAYNRFYRRNRFYQIMRESSKKADEYGIRGRAKYRRRNREPRHTHQKSWKVFRKTQYRERGIRCKENEQVFLTDDHMTMWYIQQYCTQMNIPIRVEKEVILERRWSDFRNAYYDAYIGIKIKITCWSKHFINFEEISRKGFSLL